MVPKLIRAAFLLIGAVVIFVLGVLLGSTLNGPVKVTGVLHTVITSPNKAIDKPLKSSEQPTLSSIKEQALKSFSFAYNITHLWSMRLADENYHRIARLLPCRTVKYVGGPRNETMNSCDPSVIEEYSVESILNAQQWIYEHQNPVDCKDKRFAIIHQYAWSGFGSTVHQILWAFGVALGEDRIAVYQKPGSWLYGSCPSSNPDCLFLPISNCSVPSKIDGNQTVLIAADFGHWVKPKIPPIFQNRSFNWYRSQLLFYLMRYNPQTLAHVQNATAQYFNPPSVDLHRPYVAVYIRRSDKVLHREMTQAYPLQQYFDLFHSDARLANISNVYLNSEDPKVFNEFDQVTQNKEKPYKLLFINATKNIVFMSFVAMSLEQRKPYILEFLTDLYIEINADLHAGTLTSNWCRLVDEMRLALGKMLPYYTPENRYLIDM